MIKTLIFDLGRVIVPLDMERGYAALQPHCRYSPEEIPRRIASTSLVPDFESGRIGPREFVVQLSQILDLRVEYEQFCGLWNSIFLPDSIVPESMVEALRRRYRVLLLSNTNAIHFEMVREAYPVLRHFDDYILSYEVGAMKPEPAIYEAALRRAEGRPEECFFTDDIPSYVEGARRAGIDAVPFVSLAKLERDLKERGISW